MHFNVDDLQLIHFADPVMTHRPPAFDFEKDGDKAEELADVLHKKMLQFGGAGLSANQVGLEYRVFVFGTKEQRYVFFNPEVIGVSKEEVAMSEGCLSFPGFFLTLKRPESCAIAFQNEKGEHQTVQLTGIAARIALHEYDHMEGLNFTQHASIFKLQWELEKLKKKQKKILKRMHNGRR